MRLRKADLVPVVPVVVGAWLFIAYSVGQWRAMDVPSWDLAIFSQLAKAYAAFDAPIVPIKGDGYNLLGDHFHPILIVLGPLWRLAPSPLTLLIVQDLLLAVSAWPITRLSVRLLGPVSGLALGLFYVLAWGFQGAVAAQFHEIAFAVPMLAWASVAFVEQRWLACALWLVPLVLVKEDLGLTVFMAGLAIALRGWRDRSEQRAAAPADRSGPKTVGRTVGRARDDGADGAPRPTTDDAPGPTAGSPPDAPRQTTAVGHPAATPVPPDAHRAIPGTAPAHPATSPWARHTHALRQWATSLTAVQIGLGLAVFGVLAFIVTVAIILPALSPSGVWEYGLGDSGSAAAGNPLTRLFSPEVKLATLLMIACTAGFLGLASPWITLVLPTLAWRFLSSKEFYWDWQHWHYNAVLIPIAVGALLDVVARLKERRRGEAAGWLGTPRWVRWAVAAGVAVPLVTGATTADDLALWSLTTKGYGATTERVAAAHQVIDAIPAGATVETDLSLLAYLVPDATVSWVGTSQVDTDYVIIDSQSAAWGGNPPRDAAQWATEQSTQGSRYELIMTLSGFQVAQRVQ